MARVIISSALRTALRLSSVSSTVVAMTPRAVPFFLPRAAASTAAAQVQTFLDRKEVMERVATVLKNFEKVDGNKVAPAAHFVNDLGLDSLDIVEVCMALEEEFCIVIPDAEAEKILSVEDAVTFIATHPQAK